MLLQLQYWSTVKLTYFDVICSKCFSQVKTLSLSILFGKSWSISRVFVNCVVPENIHTPHGGFFQFAPHPPGFSVPEGLAVLPPPTPRKFHDFPTWPPTPWKIHFYKKNEIRVIYIYFITIYLKCQNVLYKWTKTFPAAQFLRKL